MTGFAPPRDFTRRALLVAGAGAAAAAAIPEIAMAAKERAGLKLSHLERSTWEPLVGTVIMVRDRGYQPVPLTLVKVADIPTYYKQGETFRTRSFYVVLRGPATPLAGDTHVLKVPGAGKAEVWFSRIRQTDDGWEYLAVFANTKLTERAHKRSRGTSRRKKERIKRRRPGSRTPQPEPTPEPAPPPEPATPDESFAPNG